MIAEDGMFVEPDKESIFVFFFCTICPLSIPFIHARNAYLYLDGHRHNAYHKRRLELRQ